MRLKEVYSPYTQMVKLLEQKEGEVTVLILTKDEEGRGPTSVAIKKYCDGKGISCFDVFSDEAFTFDKEAGGAELTIHNFDGREKKLSIVPNNTACFVRGSVMEDEAGRTILRSIQGAGVFMINSAEAMDLSRNKLLTSTVLQKEGLPHPRTSFVNNENSIDLAVEAVGGEFPLIVKTLIGAEGIGVIRVDQRDSLMAILQALWNEGAELLLQEYIPIDFDIRTLVLAGEILGTTLRKKIDKDFRTNLSLGAETVPYQLSEEEQKMILHAAKAVSGYFVGVDHIVSKKKGKKEYFILEVNGSPGTRSNFGSDDKKIIPSQKIIQQIVDSARDKSTWAGYSSDESSEIEKVEVEGIGELQARVDTGNESSNSLHATDIKEKNGMVTFKTANDQTVTTKVVARAEIDDDGEGSPSARPVIRLDMVFKGTRYKGTKFNLTDRSGNEYPVLIGVKFLKRADTSVNVNK